MVAVLVSLSCAHSSDLTPRPPAGDGSKDSPDGTVGATATSAPPPPTGDTYSGEATSTSSPPPDVHEGAAAEPMPEAEPEAKMEAEGHNVAPATDFGDDTIDGALEKPDGSYLESRKRTRSAAPAPVRGKMDTPRGAGGTPGAPGAGARAARPEPAPRPSSYVPPVAAPAMKAGRHDDNKEYNRFIAFLRQNAGLVRYPVDITERLVLRTLDKDGKSLADCKVAVKSQKGELLSETTTYADGRTQFFPAASGQDAKDYIVEGRCLGETRQGQLARNGRREVELRFTKARKIPKRVPVDIAIVLDTTGSMGSQIDRLKKTLRAIHFQLTQLNTQPDIRFGLVAYRDRGDDYVTRITQLGGDVAAFQQVLEGLDANGGGDTPEDLQTALEKAMHALQWRDDALRLGFFISDATAHTDYGQNYDYREAMRESLARGIKWTAIGAGGLGRDGEVIFRQIAQYTMGEYVFITESGAGDSEGGVGEASRHVGTNYVTENLDQAIVRIVRRELSYLTDSPRDFDNTIHVAEGGSRDLVLKPAVAEALRQLADYSAIRLEGTPVAVVPTTATDAKYKDVAGYITDQMVLAASRNPAFKVLERDLEALSQEMKLQFSDFFDAKQTIEVGKMVGAEALLVSKLQVGAKSAELYAKLVRVQTGEVLAVARVEIAEAALGGS